MICHKIEYSVNPYLLSTGICLNGQVRATSRLLIDCRPIGWIKLRPDLKIKNLLSIIRQKISLAVIKLRL